ncbi:hypothetical protein BJ878DRAFT_540394 [Calycina marina]|uniref:Uncharacterized protein n=1 Tax=Calycina marina TaxID=1763456 RepID=A0A9P7Z671_9HELO|nr:hypothetical protein BJ878DRAFT_540394 [Calycina marina]
MPALFTLVTTLVLAHFALSIPSSIGVGFGSLDSWQRDAQLQPPGMERISIDRNARYSAEPDGLDWDRRNSATTDEQDWGKRRTASLPGMKNWCRRDSETTDEQDWGKERNVYLLKRDWPIGSRTPGIDFKDTENPNWPKWDKKRSSDRKRNKGMESASDTPWSRRSKADDFPTGV